MDEGSHRCHNLAPCRERRDEAVVMAQVVDGHRASAIDQSIVKAVAAEERDAAYMPILRQSLCARRIHYERAS